MKYLRIFGIPAFLMCCFSIAYAQQFASYYDQTLFLPAPASAFGEGLLGFGNPAIPATLTRLNARFYWQATARDDVFSDTWGIFAAVPNLGFSAVQTSRERPPLRSGTTTQYQITLAEGNRTFATGIAYAWSTGEKAAFSRENLISLGAVFRPARRLSLGFISRFSTETSAREGVVSLGIRPLGTPRWTLFGDAALQRGEDLQDARWSVGSVLEVVPGLGLSGRYFDTEAFTMGLSIGLGRTAISAQSHFDTRQRRLFNTYSSGFGEYRPNVFAPFFRNKHFAEIKLKGRVDYLKYQWFDRDTHKFMDILQHIRRSTADARIAVLALNLSGMRILPEHAWELRTALQNAQAAGKKVVIFLDNGGMTTYHLASVADRVMMDPEGSLMLPGYRLGRTFYKGTLDKLGLGFDEWRFFKYKSAAEALSRDRMSEADREQRQEIADAFYEVSRGEICASRNLSPAQFDSLVNQRVYFLAEDARSAGLVDTLCRWNAVGDVIKSLAGGKKMRLPLAMLAEAAQPYSPWREPPAVAVVYALGECAMDSGIRARWLEGVLRGLAKDRSVKAVVFRVDSPGGDGLASDVVAEALKAVAKEKPVVVSQGQVAASGGYWISMYGDTILAGPTTLTGSIGVIAGWIYDKGFSGKLGMSSDLVKRGDHADLGFGVTLPLLGIQVPARNLSAEERREAEKFVLRWYDRFVSKVAAGREMPEARVREIAQGRVWSGTQGRENGLVDRIGGLDAAIDLARHMAGVEDQPFQIREIPENRGLFHSNFLSPVSFQSQLMQEPTVRFIQLMSEKPGFPRPMLLPGEYPVLDENAR